MLKIKDKKSVKTLHKIYFNETLLQDDSDKDYTNMWELFNSSHIVDENHLVTQNGEIIDLRKYKNSDLKALSLTLKTPDELKYSGLIYNSE